MMNYAIVGDGRLARHFSHYFQLLEIPHRRWARDARSPFNTFGLPDAEQRLQKTIAGAGRVLLLVADNAIGPVLKQYPFLHEKPLIHCSGASSFPGVAGAHPLMTFADELYDLETYRSVPFVLEPGCRFEDLFPGLSNPNTVISVEDKARYHAMCVMAGNFSQLMWKDISTHFEHLGLPADSLHPYLQQVAKNFIASPDTALTGPLARGDRQTIEKNILSLEGDPLQGLYRAFVDFYQGDAERGQTGQARMEQTRMEQIS